MTSDLSEISGVACARLLPLDGLTDWRTLVQRRYGFVVIVLYDQLILISEIVIPRNTVNLGCHH